jgi:hypothetical protein
VKLLLIAMAAFAVASPPKTVKLAIVHTLHGCHIWQGAHSTAPAQAITLARGGKLELRVNCPMDFTLVQRRGPKLLLGDPTMHTGTSRTIVFRKAGVYVLQATNIQTSTEQGLQTFGPDNLLKLTVTVR